MPPAKLKGTLYVAILVSIVCLLWFVKQRISPTLELEIYEAVAVYLTTDIDFEWTLQSKPTRCNSSEDNFVGIDRNLVELFLHANDKAAYPIQIGSLRKYANIVEFGSSLKLRNAGRPSDILGPDPVFLSRAGITKDGKSALICISGSRGASAYLLSYDHGWKITKEISLWTT